MTSLLRNALQPIQCQMQFWQRTFHVSAVANKNNKSARYRPSIKKNKPLTYEMANTPELLAHRKSWNSWNTSNVEGGNRPSETAVEDMFIRRFVTGTWHDIFISELIIKRQHNIIRIAGVTKQNLAPGKFYFLIGYTQELLSYWLQCPVKMELQSVTDKEAIVYKYI